MARSFDGDRQRSLMLGARSGLPSWLDLATVRDVTPNSTDILVVDIFDLIHTEIADLPARIVAAPTTKPASRPIA